MADVIDLTHSSDDDKLSRPIRPLPTRKGDARHTPVVIISSDDDGDPKHSTSTLSHRQSVSEPMSRKGKEVERMPRVIEGSKEGNVASRTPVTSPKKIGASFVNGATSIGCSSTHQLSSATGPKVRIAVDTIFGDERTLLNTINGSRVPSEVGIWSYRRRRPQPGDQAHAITVECSFPDCPVLVTYRDVASDGQRWRRLASSRVCKKHDHPSHSLPTRVPNGDHTVPDRREALSGPSSRTIPVKRSDLTEKTTRRDLSSTSRSASPHKAAPSKAEQRSVIDATSIRQEVLPFRPLPPDSRTNLHGAQQASSSKTAVGPPASQDSASIGHRSKERSAQFSEPRQISVPKSDSVKVKGSKPDFSAALTDTPKVGEKRKHQGAFGSHRKPDREPGVLPIGREFRRRLEDSPGEVSGIIPLDTILPSPWVPKSRTKLGDRHAARSDTSAASSPRATPTPAQPPARSIGTSLVAGPSKSQPNALRASSPLKQPAHTVPATPSRSPHRDSSNAPILLAHDEAMPDPPARSTASASASDLSTRTDALEPDLLEPPEVSDPPRPKRPRPAAGTYTVPSMDAEQWPTTPGSSSKAQRSRRRRRTRSPTKTQSSESISTKPLPASSTPRQEPTTTLKPPDSLSRSARRNAASVQNGRQSISASSSSSTIIGSTAPAIYVTPTRSIPQASASKVSTTSQISARSVHATPPSRRRSRPSTSTSKKMAPSSLKTVAQPLSSPEEEEETIEEEDLLAEFGDFHFDQMSPLQSQTLTLDETPQTPTAERRQLKRVTPKTGGSRTVPATPKSQKRPLADTSKANLRSPPKQSLQVHKSPTATLSPSVLRRNNNSLVAAILADAAKEDAAQKRRQAEDEARQKRMAALLEEDEPLDDSLADVSLEMVLDDDMESQGGQSETGSRRSARIRANSVTNQPKPQSRPQSRPKVKPLPPVNKNDPSYKFFKEQARLQKAGIGFDSADRILRAIQESETPMKPAGSHRSDQSSADSSDDEGDLHVDVDALEQHEGLGGLLDVAREVQQSTAGESDVAEWEGFWERAEEETRPDAGKRAANSDTETETNPALPSISAAAPHLPAITSEATASLSQKRPQSRNLLETVRIALCEADATESQMMVDSVLHEIHRASSSPLGEGRELLELCLAIWRAYGARPEVCAPSRPRVPQNPRLGREAVSCLLVQVLHALAQRHWLAADASDVAPVLLLLAVDPITSTPLRRDIERLLDQCWDDQSPDDIARWAISNDSLPSSIKVQMLQVIGHRTASAKSLARRVALGWLVPDSSRQSIFDKGIDIHGLIIGGEHVLEIARQANPPLETLSDNITFLFEAVSDLESSIRQTPYKSRGPDDRHPVEHLKALIRKISIALPPPSNDIQRLAVSRIKSRLFSLESLLEMQYVTIFDRMSRARMGSRLENRGLKEGKNGQTTLSLKGA